MSIVNIVIFTASREQAEGSQGRRRSGEVRQGEKVKMREVR